MIFFHGTTEENIKSIKKDGLKNATSDPWIVEITGKNVCCLSKEPTSGEGGNASYFAGKTKSSKQNGYLVVIRIHREELLQDKLITIFDNKDLDDYARQHFFTRKEFRSVGYQLYQELCEYKKQDSQFKRLENYIKSQKIETEHPLIQDRHYYRELYSPENRHIYKIFDIEISDELYDLLKKLGIGTPFYEFLSLHFSHITPQQHLEFSERNLHLDDLRYWQAFYHQFPLNISKENQKYINLWFIPQWLESKKKSDITENCQILVKSIQPAYILGIIQITNTTGVLPEFRSGNQNTFSRAIWKKVNKILEENRWA